MVDEPHELPAWLEEINGQRIPIRGPCTFGRSSSNQVALSDERVSRRHAIIHVQEESEFWLVDLGSRNGTYLNGRRVVQPIRLQNGDQISVGPFLLTFRQTRTTGSPLLETSAAHRTVAEIKPTRCWLVVADMIDSSRLMQEVSPDELPILTGQWLAECKQMIEECGGSINQFLGDGFLAYWYERDRTAVTVERALQSLKRLQAEDRPRFRVVAHFAQIFVGGASLGEERLSGPEVNFVFRMEKLAAALGEPRMLSEAAWERLAAWVEARPLGDHPLKGFDGRFPFYAF